ncbi:hypothetical protein ACIKTA_01445 [Hansschlegelia beijingensis]
MPLSLLVKSFSRQWREVEVASSVVTKASRKSLKRARQLWKPEAIKPGAVVSVRLRCNHGFNGNSLDDLAKVVLERRAIHAEMDFLLNKEGMLVSGHDADSYLGSSGVMISDVTAPYAVVNRRGARVVTLDIALALLPPGSQLFIDLKDTKNSVRRDEAILAAVKAVEASRRGPDEAVIMAYDFGGAAGAMQRSGLKYALKHSLRPKLTEREAIRLLKKAERLGCRYFCYPAHPSYKRLAAKAKKVRLLVPLFDLAGAKSHFDNGTTLFISKWATSTVERATRTPPPPKLVAPMETEGVSAM